MAESAEAWEKAKKKRATIRGLTTKILGKIQDEMSKDQVDESLMEELLVQLEEKAALLLDLDNIVEDGIQDMEDLEAEILSSQDYRERILSAKTRVKRHLEKSDRSVSAESTANSAASSTTNTVRLPRLTIDKFSGDITQWQAFWAQYESAFHSNQGLSKIDKFQYLKGLLSGTAANSISGLTLTVENYDEAVRILKGRFGRKDIIVSAHVNKLLNLPSVRHVSDLEGLRKLYDVCEVQVRSLQSAGIQISAYGSLLYPLLVKIMPEELVLEFNRNQKQSEDWNVTELLEFLKGEIESRERTRLFKTIGNDRYSQSNKEDDLKSVTGKTNTSTYNYRAEHNLSKKRLPSAATLSTSAEKGCLFCEQTHETEKCELSTADKFDKLKEQGRCFLCLRGGHTARFCRFRFRCKRCKKRHNTYLCEANKMNANDNAEKSAVVSSLSQGGDTGQVVFLQTATAVAEGKNRSVAVRCLLDGGSQRTFVTEELSKNLGLKVIGHEYLTIHNFGNPEPQTVKRKKVKLVLRNAQNSLKRIEIEALETPIICGAIIQIPSKDIKDHFAASKLQLADVSTTNCPQSKISVLLGADTYWKIASGETKRISETLVAIQTLFGWTVQGVGSSVTLALAQSSIGMLKVVVSHVCSEEDLASSCIQNFWKLESLGITEDASCNDDRNGLEVFKSAIQYNEGRYQISFPWKESHPVLEDNHDLALGRFNRLVRKFRENPAMYTLYRNVIDDYLAKGIVEPVKDAGKSVEGRTFYVPHHPVIRKDKATTQLRIVFDASSHAKDHPSLNDCLIAGPNLNPDLMSLLIKFRMHAVAITADIEGAYLQIALDPRDRDAVRFFWIKEDLMKGGQAEIQVLRMARVPFGVTSSPFLLAATIKNHLTKFKDAYPEACKMLDNSLYVDDLIGGAETNEEALQLSTEMKTILSDAGMNLRKWQTNSRELVKKWENNAQSPGPENSGSTNAAVSLKVLGLCWQTDNDSFYFDGKALNEFLVNKRDTKRGILQAAGRIYDPIGFLSPYTIRTKMLFQTLWERKINWDDNLPDDLTHEWQEWCSELPLLRNIIIPRCYWKNGPMQKLTDVQLHCFSDSSEKAYGAVVFLRYTREDGEIGTAFVTAKARVAPLKNTTLTLPRLELLGALLAVRLSNSVYNLIRDKIPVTCYFWTDSMITLYWIKGPPSKWKQFIQNRVKEIQERSDPFSWRHCPGPQNPADIMTRGYKLQSLQNNNQWWEGPKWLQESSNNWPITKPDSQQDLGKIDCERKATFQITTQVSCVLEQQLNTHIFDIQMHSTLRKILRITGWIKRFVSNARNPEKRLRGPLTAHEIKSAEMYWIKKTQWAHFENEMQNLTQGKPVSPSSKLCEFKPFLDENSLLRVGGRLQMSLFTFEQKHPLIIPDKSHFTDLLIQSSHKRMGHAGVAETLAQLRETFWIIKGRQRVKNAIHKCIVCKRFSAKPMSQETAPLPAERISEAPPFAVTGLDFAGPLHLREGRGKTVKAYIALFTCAVTRALHLELVSNMTTEMFLLAFRRFVSRRGLCKMVISDNALTFKRADKELRALWKNMKNEALQEYFGSNGVTWRNITEFACWWGGFYERMVREVKTCLRKILGTASLSFEEMETTLVEVEAILNSRPLTFMYNEIGEPSPLTPGHFLVGNRLTALPPSIGRDTTCQSTRDEITRRYNYRQRLLNQFWRKWRKNYIQDLRSAHQRKSLSHTEIKENQVVLIFENLKPRQLWRMGIITKTHFGRDGKVRSCDVRLPNRKTIKRPVQLLYPLEMES